MDRLIKIWSKLPDKILNDSTLLILGSGVEQQNLEQLTKILELKNVLFISAKSFTDLPFYYAAGDIFILPTLEDGWGLVVNEAMSCAKPILCSRYAGCCNELIIDGENGYIFDPLDEESTKQAIIKICSKNSNDLYNMGMKSKKIIADFNYERMVKGFKQAIYSCLNTAR